MVRLLCVRESSAPLPFGLPCLGVARAGDGAGDALVRNDAELSVTFGALSSGPAAPDGSGVSPRAECRRARGGRVADGHLADDFPAHQGHRVAPFRGDPESQFHFAGWRWSAQPRDVPERALDSGAHSKVYRWRMPASPNTMSRSRRVPVEVPQAEQLPSAGGLRIGDLAARAGVSADTLRYYERRGLLRPSGRRASGYREYPPEAADIVHFIKHAQLLGFTLAEIDELLQLRGSAARRGTGLAVHEVAVAKMRDIDEKIRMLGTLRRALADLVVECEQTCGPDTVVEARDCPIIAALCAENLADVAPESARTTSDRSVSGPTS